MPVPQPDVLKRRLVVGRVGRPYGRLGGKLVLRKAVQAVSLTRHFDVMGNKGRLAHQFVRLDNKAVDVPANHADHNINDHRRRDGRDEPAPAWLQYAACNGDCRPQQQSRANDQQADKGYVRICVSDSLKDGVMFK